MSITKQSVIDQITITENGVCMYRTVTKIVEDGIVLTQAYHRDCVYPGQNLSEIPEKVAVRTWKNQASRRSLCAADVQDSVLCRGRCNACSCIRAACVGQGYIGYGDGYRQPTGNSNVQIGCKAVVDQITPCTRFGSSCGSG